MMQGVSELFSEDRVKVWLEQLPQPVERFNYFAPKEISSSYRFRAKSVENENVAQDVAYTKDICTKRYVAEFRVTMESLVNDAFIRETDREEVEAHIRKEMQARTVHYLYGGIQKELKELIYEVMRLESYSHGTDPYNGPSARLESILQKISL